MAADSRIVLAETEENFLLKDAVSAGCRHRASGFRPRRRLEAAGACRVSRCRMDGSVLGRHDSARRDGGDCGGGDRAVDSALTAKRRGHRSLAKKRTPSLTAGQQADAPAGFCISATPLIFSCSMAVSKSKSSSSIQPDPQQQQAIEHVTGPMLVVAGAGTGKTTVLIRRIAIWFAKAMLVRMKFSR